MSTLKFLADILHVDSPTEAAWVTIGMFGQLLFTGRFLLQWISSERARRSIIPIAFWYFSIGGGVILLSYAIYRKDPVFIVGQSMGVFIYLRNIWLIRAESQRSLSSTKNHVDDQAGARQI